jgi:DNA-directed RNA polymerase subunit RPC12/RpoP
VRTQFCTSDDGISAEILGSLEDLRAWHLVEASCRRCRHRAILAHELLLRDRPAYTRLFELERALRCRRCGAQGQASLTIRLRPRD